MLQSLKAQKSSRKTSKSLKTAQKTNNIARINPLLSAYNGAGGWDLKLQYSGDITHVSLFFTSRKN